MNSERIKQVLRKEEKKKKGMREQPVVLSSSDMPLTTAATFTNFSKGEMVCTIYKVDDILELSNDNA